MRRGLIHRLDPWRRGFALMAVFALLFSNVPPQLTAAAEQYTCGSEKHLHSESCYEKKLACGEEEAAPHYKSTFKVHKHTEKCRDSEGRIVCGYVENEYYHTHNEFCRDAEGNLACGLKEQKPHEHTDACYETDRILICENEDPGHTHTGSCYTEKRVLACEKAEEESHHHSDGCYAETVIRTCGLEENPGHHHTEECWQDWTELTCGLEENEEHRHGEECYTGHHDLICGQEEQDGHQHSESCFETIWELTCGQEEKEGHHHSDACYTTELELTCGEEERPVHIHSDDCYREERRLICNKPTSTHRHSDACFNEQGMAICGKVEVPVFESTAENRVGGHTHTEECYEKKLTCELPEHIHSEDCRTESKAEDPENTELETEEMKAGEKQAEEGQNASSEDNITESEKEAEAETAVEAETEEGQDTSSEDGNTEPEEETEAEPAVEAEVEAETETESEVETETEAGTEAETEKKAETETESENTTAETERELPTAITLEAKDAPVQVAVTFSPEAGIPEGTELFVADAADSGLRGAELPSAGPMKKSTGGLKKSALRTRAAEETGLPTADVSLVQWQEGEEAPRIELYHRTLEISLLSDGQTIEPAPGARVSVSVVLPDLEEGLTVEVRHETAEGSILLESSTSGQSVTFTTDSFSVFDFTSTAQKITSWTSDWLENTLYGRTNDQNVNHGTISIDEDSIPDGFSIIDTTSTTQNSNLWITLQRVKDIVLGKLESISLYAVENGRITALVKENVGITDVLRLNLGNYSSFALVRDSGLRSRIEEIGNVVLSGLMPKNGVAEATDVTEEYENFLGGRSVSKEGEADEDLGGQSSDKEGEAIHTIAAIDITITNDGEEYQPEENPVTVSIQDAAIATAVANGNAITLWHVLDDGTTEQITDFTVDGDTVTFDASGFSVYVITETTVEKIMTAADGNVYRITVTYDGSAQIPEGAELVVNEVGEGEYLSSAAAALGIDEDYLLYRKFLDISFKTTDENGEERIIEPATPVKVQIELLDVEVGADKLQVVHFGENGAEKVSSTSSADAVITFTSNEFSVFGFGNVLEPQATAETDEASIELLGFGAETELTATDAPEVEEGLEVLGTYKVSETDKVWIRAELKEDVELSSMESVAIYSVKDSAGIDETAGKPVEELAEAGNIVELTSTEFAVIKDTGYRHLSFNITPDEEDEEKTVTLDGMMPKAAVAAAVDVTEQFSDHDFTESAPVYNDETGAESIPVDEESAPENNEETMPMDDDSTEEDQSASSDEDHTTSRVTLAAFDISIQNGEVDYQPDETHPVTVTITDERILSGDHNLELWHIRDDGSEERVSSFTVSDGKVEFTATGFSTYVIVYNITTYYQTADGETYKITVEYGDEAGLPEGVELRVSELDGQEYLADAATALETEESYLLYRKFLDISFVTTDENGEEKVVEPHAAVKVCIELQDVTAGADKLQVVHFGDEGVEKLTSTANDAAVVTFETGSFSVFGIGNMLTPLATAETDEASIEILGFGGEAQINTADAPAVEEGLEVLGAYNLSNETEKVWIKADVKDGVELSSMESVVIYTIKDSIAETPTEDDEASTGDEQTSEVPDEKPTEDQAAEQNEEQSSVKSETVENGLVSELAEAGTVAELTVSNFALVKDTGYRHLNFEISVVGETPQEEIEEGTSEALDESGDATANVIILDGMMPKMATATAVDVTEAYTDHEYVVPEEEQIEDQEQIDELNTEAEGEELPEEQPLSNDAGENEPKQPVNDGEEPAEQQDSAEEPQEGMEDEVVPTRTTLAAFNITISDNNSEYQPDEDHPITVEIRDDRITGAYIELWHIKDNGTEERMEDFSITDGGVEFVAQSFSVYTIVDAPAPPADATEISSVDEIVADQGYTLRVVRDNESKYMLGKIKNSKYMDYVTTEKNAETWYFDEVEGKNQYYYIYCYNAQGEKNYLQFNNGGFAMSNSNGAEFYIRETWDNVGTFYINTYKQGSSTEYAISFSGKYKAFAYETGRQYGNTHNQRSIERVYLKKSSAAPYNYYKLHGKTYGIVYHEESIKGAGLLTTPKGSAGLQATELWVRPNVLDHDSELLLAKGTEIAEWTFECFDSNRYYISIEEGGVDKYLTLSNGCLVLSTTKTANSLFTVEGGTGTYKGKYRFSIGNYKLMLRDGKASNGFILSTDSSADKQKYTWLNLAVIDPELTDKDFVVYSAEKVSISDTTAVYNQADVVVFTRVWNEDEKKYEFYIIDYDGSLIRCYESGDMIQWIGSAVNTAEWKFTEYYESDGVTANNYYELQNNYSHDCITPQASSTPLKNISEYPNYFDRSINLNGRRNGYHYSTITTWDDANYSFASLKTDMTNGKVTSGALGEAEIFYFAIMKPYVEEATELTEVTTLEHTQYGITMKIKDIDTRATMSDFLGSNIGGAVTTTDPNLLAASMGNNSYPTVTSSGASLGVLYSGATPVNHLFIANTYYTSGYYEFDSTQNFATLVNNGDVGNKFTVYEQLGTYDGGQTKDSLRHGQFLPYNTIVPGKYATTHGQNLYDALVRELADSNPRKYEQLYTVEHDGETANCYFAVELEASFSQTADGKDAWGHDIIYEFTGDDDFWLYVDGELIIDLGGIHSALAGNVNYSTGRVVVNGNETSLYEIFESHYKAAGMSDDEVTAALNSKFEEKTRNGQKYRVFRDNTPHTMRIFYMERGAGASNIHMRFNLASVKQGTIELKKEITGVEDTSSFMAEYPYQINYQQRGSDVLKSLNPLDDTLGIKVVFKDTNDEKVPFRNSFTASDGTTYSNVFLLRPGQIAEIQMPADTIQYEVVECCVDTDIYDPVKANGNTLTGKKIPGKSDDYPRKDFSTGLAVTSERPKVIFDNHVRDGVLRTLYVTKRMHNEDGTQELNHDQIQEAFSFRLYMGTENDNLEDLPLADMQLYHVIDNQGYYCKWDAAAHKLVSLGKTDYNALTDEEKAVATFNTSINGSVSNIQVQYTAVFPEILAGTKIMVSEWENEIPDGFSLQGYVLKEDISDADDAVTTKTVYTDTPMIVEDNKDPLVEIHNLKGWGLRVNKIWSDESFMDQREDVYFAVFVNDNGTLRRLGEIDANQNTVRRLKKGESSLYWYMPKLLPAYPSISQYEIHEVKLEKGDSFAVDDDGVVTGYTSVTPQITSTIVNGHQIGNELSDNYQYTVSYVQGSLTDESNVREDTITNNRKGIELYKEDMEGNPLPNAVFQLQASDGSYAGSTTYTSAGNGLITIAYLRFNEPYTLTEINAPAGYQAASYHASQRALTITLYDDNTGHAAGIEVSGGDLSSYYSVENYADSAEHYGRITVKNKKYTLDIKKVDENGAPMEGVHFALYKQVNSVNGPRKDYRPLDGYSDLATDENGYVPLIKNAFKNGEQNGGLGAGIYYLTETETPETYQPLSNDVIFEVTATGAVLLKTGTPADVSLFPSDPSEEGEIQVDYVITVPNTKASTKTITVKKQVLNGSAADESGKSSFEFTVRLFMPPDGQNPWPYNDSSQGFKNGRKTFALSNNGEITLTVPTGAIMTIVETEKETGKDWYTTQFQWNDETVKSGNTWSDTISEDGTVTFINTRKRQTINIKKTLSDQMTKDGVFSFTAELTDYGINVTSGETGLSTFEIDVVNNVGTTTQFSLPVGATLKINEILTGTQSAIYDTKIQLAGSTAVTGTEWTGTIPDNSGTITVTNTRKKQTVTITKELVDAIATGAVSFPFTVTLYQADGTTTINSYELNGKTIKTGNGKNGSTLGVATFNLSVTNGTEGKASQPLTVPYGAVLVIREGEVEGGNTYSTTITETVGTSVLTTSDKTATVTVTDNATIYYKNTLLQGEANLTISKTVEDLATGSTDGSFTFEVSNLDASTEYNYTPQIKSGTEWVAYTDTTWADGTASSKSTDDSGKLTFTLYHNTRVVLKIPAGKTVTVTETNSGGFTPSYRVTYGTGTPGNSVSGNSYEVLLNGNKTIDFTNTKGVVAPTNFSTRHTPWILLLLFGLMLLMGGGVIVKRRRGNEPDDGGTLEANHTPIKTGPPPTQPMHSTTDIEDHIRWRNSVWVEETHTPPQMRRTDISCPQAKLWMTSGGGDAG